MKITCKYSGLIGAIWLALGLLIGCTSERSKSTYNATTSPDTNAPAGQTAAFSVAPTGTAPFTYQWYNTNAALATNVQVGGTATFIVAAATNGQPLYYQWHFNGTNISGATNK